jgi:flagellar biosynthesis/type III secretory pathway protein FliH
MPAAVFPSFGATRKPAPAEPRADARVPSTAAADALVERARREGFEAGAREARAQTLATVGRRLGDAAEALALAARELDARRAELAADLERELPRVVLALVEQVLCREAVTGATLAREAVVACAARLKGGEGGVVVRLHPATASAFEAWRVGADGPGGQVALRVETDASLGPGDWLVETADGLVDGRRASRLETLRRLLLEPDA